MKAFLDTPLHRLVETVFACDAAGSAVALTLVTDRNTVSFNVEDGYIVDSSLKGPGQTLVDFLLMTNRVSRETHDAALRQSKEEQVSPLDALLARGALAPADLALAKHQLGAQRFSLFLGAAHRDVHLEPAARRSGGAGVPGAQRAVALLFEHLRIAIGSGARGTLRLPSRALLRPTERLGRYIDLARGIVSHEIPLPLAGGETAEAIEARCGPDAPMALSVLLMTGLLTSEVEREPGRAGEVGIDNFLRVALNMALVSARETAGDGARLRQAALETGGLLLDGFGAKEPALAALEKIAGVPAEEDETTERKILLCSLAGRMSEFQKTSLAVKIASLPAGRGDKALLLRHLAVHHWAVEQADEAVKNLHEAFLYAPDDPENLSLFVQMFLRDPSIAGKETSSDRIMRAASAGGAAAPEVLPLALACARENREFDLVSWIVRAAFDKLRIGSDVFDLVIDIFRELGWGPDIVEFITRFTLLSGKAGWSNPLWSLGAAYASEKLEETARFARDAYDILLRTSAGRQPAMQKLVGLMEKVAHPGEMLDVLEQASAEAADRRQRAAVDARLVRLLGDGLGDARGAADVAARLLEDDAAAEGALDAVSRALRGGVLGARACRRAARALAGARQPAGGDGAKALSGLAAAAVTLAGDLPSGLLLFGKVARDYPATPEAKAAEEEIRAIHARRRELKEKVALLKERADLINDDYDAARVRGKEADAAALAGAMLELEEERERGGRLVETLLAAGVPCWDLVCRALAFAEEGDADGGLVLSAVRALPGSAGDARALAAAHEIARLCRERSAGRVGGSGGDEVEEGAQRFLLDARPADRDAVRFFMRRAASAGDAGAMIALGERRLSFLSAPETGQAAFELATAADLSGDPGGRGGVFWKMAAAGMHDHPPVLMSRIEELLAQEDWPGTAALLDESERVVPRYLCPSLRRIALSCRRAAGDRAGGARVAGSLVKESAWCAEVVLPLVEEALREGPGDGGELLGPLLGGLLAWHSLHPRLLPLAGAVVEMAEARPGARADAAAFLGKLADMPLMTGDESYHGSEEITGLFSAAAQALSRWGHPREAVRCVERGILVAGESPARRTLLVLLAEVHRSEGAGGLEGLLLTLLRLRQEAGCDETVDEYVAHVYAAHGLDLLSDESLGQIVENAMGGEGRRLRGLVLAAVYALVGGSWDLGAARAERFFDEHPDVAEAGVFAALCWEKLQQWERAIGVYAKIASVAPGGADAAKLMKRSALIADLKLGREKDALAFLLRAIELAPQDEGLLREIAAKAEKLKDRNAFIRAHEIVENHLPGKQTQRAFYFKYAREMEEVFKDPEGAVRILLQALALFPKKGPVLDDVARIALHLQRFQPMGRAAAIMRGAGAPRKELEGLIGGWIESFLAVENVPSAYGLVGESIAMDPGLDLVGAVRLLAGRGEGGALLARKLVNRWIELLEAAIENTTDDPVLYQRLDALGEMRFALEGPSELKVHDLFPASRMSMPSPDMDDEWEEIAPEEEKEEPSHPEITLDLFGKTSGPPPAKAAPAPEDAPAGEAPREEPAPAAKEGGARVPSIPPREAERIFDALGKVEEEEEPVIVLSEGDLVVEEGGDEERDEDETKELEGDAVVAVAEITVIESPPAPPDAPAPPPPVSVPAPAPGPPEAPAVEAPPSAEDDAATIERYAREPWRLDLLDELLSPERAGRRSGAAGRMLAGIRALYAPVEGGTAEPLARALPGKAGTPRGFAALVRLGPEEGWGDVLALVWEHAWSLFAQQLASHRVTVSDRVTPFSAGPVAPFIEQAHRAMGVLRASLYCKPSTGIEVKRVRTNPPSLLVLLPPGREHAGLDFHLAEALWGAAPANILAATLDDAEGARLVDAVVEAFGRYSRKEKIDPELSRLVQSLWQHLPMGAQERMRRIIQKTGRALFAGLRADVAAECARAGLLFSGDMAAALRATLGEGAREKEGGGVDRAALAGAIELSGEAQGLVAFALSRDTLAFLDSHAG